MDIHRVDEVGRVGTKEGRLVITVTITYFKPISGKYYTEDTNVEWPEDPNHFTGWKDFEEIVRLRDMFAVCVHTPLGHPVSCPPKR